MKLLSILLLMVSQFVSQKEAYYSPTAERLGIKNTPTTEQAKLVKHTAVYFFDDLRVRIGSPVYISSFFRNSTLNAAISGAPNSDHQALGDVAALDIDQDGKSRVSNTVVFNVIRSEMQYYKLIWEFGTRTAPAWVHVAYSTDPVKNSMRKTYRAKKYKNKTVYEIYR